MKEAAETHPSSGLLAVLALDPEAILVQEPRLLLDPRFLGALHAELEEEMGNEEAAIILLQVGFIHGLKDAARVVRGALSSRQIEAGSPVSPPLAIRFRANPHARPQGAIEIRGSWPERSEASAHLSILGSCPGTACFMSAGYTSGWLSGILEADILALETTCRAGGGEDCHFVAREAEAWRAIGDRRAGAMLDALPFDDLRELIRGSSSKPPGAQAGDRDQEVAVIHIWGPVMVIPFEGVDEALRAVELIGCDPAASEVSVVVLDLSNVTFDEPLEAAGLGRVLEAIEAWGAEAIVAEVSPSSEPAVDGIEPQPLLVHRDLHHAIAAAFQIADSQRRMI